MQWATLKVEKRNSIGRILLDRPEKKNAIDPRMARELADVLDDFEADPEVRAVLMRGAGGNFCSGGDLAPERGPETRRPGSAASTTLDVMNRVYGRTIRTLHNHPKPVVALVEGVAAGAGANLALACDLVYAATDRRASARSSCGAGYPSIAAGRGCCPGSSGCSARRSSPSSATGCRLRRRRSTDS